MGRKEPTATADITAFDNDDGLDGWDDMMGDEMEEKASSGAHKAKQSWRGEEQPNRASQW